MALFLCSQEQRCQQMSSKTKVRTLDGPVIGNQDGMLREISSEAEDREGHWGRSFPSSFLFTQPS